ncbi:MAG: CAP domain-containing protein [Pseudomonadota bacterium]
MRGDFNVDDLLAGRVLYNNPFMAIFGLLGALIAIGAGGGGGSDDGDSASASGPSGSGSGSGSGGSGGGTGGAAPSALVVPDPVEADDAPAASAAPPAAPTPVLPSPPASATASSAPDLPDSAYDLGWSGLSGEEQMIVEMVNRARLDPQAEAALQNEAIAPGGSTTPQEALAVVPTLSNAARDHSRDMDNRDFFAHTNPDGDRPWDRAQDAGHENGFVGENIGWIGSTGGVGNAQGRAEAHQNNLWESDGHQVNMLSGSWSEIGLGYDYGDFVYEGTNYTGSTFATQKFGDTGQTYLTGVVIDDADDDAFYDIGEGQGGVRITAWNADGVYATATWSAGGYSLALPPGTYRVAFEGGDLDGVYETEVTIGSENVKLDVIEDRDAAGSALTASAAPDPAATLLVLAELPLEAAPEPSAGAGPDPTAAAAHLLAESPLPPQDWHEAPGQAEDVDEALLESA